MNRRTTLNRLAIVLGMPAVLTLQGCTTPAGPAFTTPTATEQDKANVYLYRQSKLNSGGQSFTVQLNDQPSEELANASFILMKVPKGEHLLKVKAGGFGKTYEHRWTAEIEKPITWSLCCQRFCWSTDLLPISRSSHFSKKSVTMKNDGHANQANTAKSKLLVFLRQAEAGMPASTNGAPSTAAWMRQRPNACASSNWRTANSSACWLRRTWTFMPLKASLAQNWPFKR